MKMIFEPVGFGIDKKLMSAEDEILYNIQFTKLMRSVQAEIKEDVCYNCGKPVSSFCNSHFVPRFCLENIGIDGRVTGYNAIIGLPSMGISAGKEAPGIGEAGTFRIICRNCDSTLFQDYENPDNYSSGEQPTQKMLAEIAMKDYLKFIYKRRIELSMSKRTIELCNNNSIFSAYVKKKIDVETPIKELDLKAYSRCFEMAKKSCQKGLNQYYIVFYKLLDYVAPIAVQSPISLSIDIEGGVVNDIFNQDPLYFPTDIHVCVFPLKNKTAVLMFINDGDKHYRKFYKQLRNHSIEEQLGIINYIIFLYCEDYFLAKDIANHVELSKFKEVAQMTPVIWSSTQINKAIQISEQYTLSNWSRIPNLLSEKYRIR